jgi:hypothetical protein
VCHAAIFRNVWLDVRVHEGKVLFPTVDSSIMATSDASYSSSSTVVMITATWYWFEWIWIYCGSGIKGILYFEIHIVSYWGTTYIN